MAGPPAYPSGRTPGAMHGRPASRKGPPAHPGTPDSPGPPVPRARNLKPWIPAAYCPGVMNERPAAAAGPPAYPLVLLPRVTHKCPAAAAGPPTYPATPDSSGPHRLGPGTRNHVCSPAYIPGVTHGRPAGPPAHPSDRYAAYAASATLPGPRVPHVSQLVRSASFSGPVHCYRELPLRVAQE